jgi:CHAD domain-containing protein
MPYKFLADEPVRQAIRRCAAEQLDTAVSELTEKFDADPESAIHNARKAIKKERSLLRLARAAMSSEERARENAALRDVARSLSGARDADVMIASVDELSERFAGQLPAATFQTVRTHFEARRGHGNGQAAQSGAAKELAALRARVDEWQLDTGGWNAIESGLLRASTRGRAAFERARASREAEDLHEWRKRVKDLWYHERLLAPACGPAVRGHAKELDRLSDLLGDDHDLAILRNELTHDGSSVAVDLEAMLNLIDHRRAELQLEATHIGERIYAEPPKAFRRRMSRSWKAGRALAHAPREHHPAQLAAATR